MEQGPPLLLSAKIASSMVGVSLRMFHELRRRDGFPKPVVLGPRAVRWKRQEIEAWVTSLTTVAAGRPQPEQLLRGKRMRQRAKPFDGIAR